MKSQSVTEIALILLLAMQFACKNEQNLASEINEEYQSSVAPTSDTEALKAQLKSSIAIQSSLLDEDLELKLSGLVDEIQNEYSEVETYIRLEYLDTVLRQISENIEAGNQIDAKKLTTLIIEVIRDIYGDSSTEEILAKKNNINVMVAGIFSPQESSPISAPGKEEAPVADRTPAPVVPNIPPVANGESVQVNEGESKLIDVLENDTDGDGSLDPAGVMLVSTPTYGSASVNTLTGAITYSNDGSQQTADSFEYKVKDNNGEWSNIATVTLSIRPSPLPVTNGLVFHVESDLGLSLASDDITVTSWQDQSNFENSLIAGGEPSIATSPNGRRIVEFDGVNDKLFREGQLNNLPNGDAERTLVFFVNYLGNGWGGFTYGAGTTNETFGPAVNNRGSFAIQGWGFGNDYNSSLKYQTVGWAVQIARISAGNSVELFVNENSELNFNHTYSTGSDRIMLGAEINDSPFVSLQMGAALIYERALDATEIALIQSYFENKYLD